MMSKERIRESLLKYQKEGEFKSIFQGTLIANTNPEMFKFYWDIAYIEKGSQALTWETELCTSEMKRLVDELTTKSISCYQSNIKLPRWGGHPLRKDSKKFDCKWATPYEYDPDPPLDGHR